MKVELAKTAGFCFGVKRAVDTVYEQVKLHPEEPIYTYRSFTMKRWSVIWSRKVCG